MKSKILSLAFSVTILFTGTPGHSQDYDLIVTTKGDSIVCRIDSITESHLHFEMKIQDRWAHTQIEKAQVSRYERNAIYIKQYVFKEGTSIIESLREGAPASIRDVQKNSVYVGYP